MFDYLFLRSNTTELCVMKWSGNLHCLCLCVFCACFHGDCRLLSRMAGIKEQQITEEKPLLPEQRGGDSDMVSPAGTFSMSSRPMNRLVWGCTVVRWPSRQRCLCSLAAIIRPCSCVLVEEELINSIQPWLFDSSVTMEGWKLIEAEGGVRGADQGSGSGWLRKGRLFQPARPSNRLWWIQGP